MAQKKSRKIKSKQIIAAKLIGQGLRQKEVAERLNVRQETVSRWSKHPEFSQYRLDARRELTRALMEENLNIINRCHQVIEAALVGNDNMLQKASLAVRYLNGLSRHKTPYEALEVLSRKEEMGKSSDQSFGRIIEVIRQLRYLRVSCKNYDKAQMVSAIDEIFKTANADSPAKKLDFG